jgi:tetratricopeptide (TPR) repeat protein
VVASADDRAAALGRRVDSLVTRALVAEEAEARRALALRADSVARFLAAVRPGHAQSHFWTAVTAGTLADDAGAREKIALGRRAYDEASRALALDSLHAGANHVVGRIHAGVMRLGWFTRLVAGRIGLGELLGEASWESAVRHLETGAELEPDRATYRLELALALRDTGDVAGARRELEAVLALPPDDDLTRQEQTRAREALRELSHEGA